MQASIIHARCHRAAACGLAAVGLWLGACHVALAEEKILELPVFSVEGTPWQYARLGDIEILSRAWAHRARACLASLLRGLRLLPEFTQGKTARPLLLILVEEESRAPQGLAKPKWVAADPRRWNDGQESAPGAIHDHADDKIHVLATNLAGVDLTARVSMNRAIRVLGAQRPEYPEWAQHGLFGVCGPISGVVGIAQSTSLRFPKLSWPDPTVGPGVYPKGAADFPPFAEMFDPVRDTETMTRDERWKFEFQCGLFARWSLFGPAKKGRDRNAFWAFAEMARRGQATEEVFRQCYQMDWPAVCAEMRRYLKTKGTGMLEAWMPHVRADVPEAERLEFRPATPEEVRRILGEFRRLREREAAAKPGETPR